MDFLSKLLLNTILKPLEGKKTTIAAFMVFVGGLGSTVASLKPEWAAALSWVTNSVYWEFVAIWAGVALTDRARRVHG